MASNGKFVVIDGNELSFEDGETILQAAARADIEPVQGSEPLRVFPGAYATAVAG